MSADSKYQIPPNLLGIQVVYCDGSQMKEVWVDLKKVSAISWGDGEMKAKGKGNGNPHGPRIPKGKAPNPTDCPVSAAPTGGTGMCWWDGSDWVCGEAEE